MKVQHPVFGSDLMICAFKLNWMQDQSDSGVRGTFERF